MMWLLLLVVLAGAVFWHVRENQQLALRWQAEMEPIRAQWLLRFAWSRSLQVIVALGCLIIVVIIYQWQLHSANKTIAELNKQNQQLQASRQGEIAREESLAARNPALSNMATDTVEPETQPIPAPPGGIGFAPRPGEIRRASNAPQLPQPSTVIPSATIQPVQQPPTGTVPPIAVTSPSPAAPNNVNDIYNPEVRANDAPSAIDALKKRYEDIFVTHMFLKKCNRVGANDYHVLTSALAQEMASINAPGRLQYDILTAAQGSYNEIYSKSSCTDSSIDQITTQYNAYITAIAANAPSLNP